jgi:hypothetical protein
MLNWLDLVKLIAPIVVAAVVPHGAVLGPLLASGISDAEQLAGATGVEKKAFVLSMVTDAVIGLNTAKGTEVLDPSAVSVAAGQAIDTTVSIVNLIHSNRGL